MEVDEAEAEVQDLLGEGGLGALLAESGIDDVQLPDTNALDFLPSVPVLPVSVPSVAPTGHAHATASRAPSSGSRASASTSGRGTRDVPVNIEPSAVRAAWHRRWLENDEYLEAATNGDLVEVADALGDQLYISRAP